jgi:hypothetical protein
MTDEEQPVLNTPDPWDDDPLYASLLTQRPAKRSTNGRRPGGEEEDEACLPSKQLLHLQSRTLTTEALLAMPPPDPLIHGVLNLSSVASVYGPPKNGKTFTMLDMACCVATGSWWKGHEVTKRPVLYLIAEGVERFGPRIDAWRRFNHHGGPMPDMTWLPARPNLRAPEWSDAVAEVAEDLGAGLVVIDTLARTFGGGEENSAKDMGQFIAGLDQIKECTGACVTVVHHTGKDRANGARGSSSLLGAVDTELEITKTEGVVRVTNTAQKDQAEGQPLRFVLAPAGDSVVLAPYTARHADGEDLGTKAREALDILRRSATPTGLSSTIWRELASEAGVGRSSFYSAVKVLVSTETVTNVGSEARPSYVPTEDLQGAEDEAA